MPHTKALRKKSSYDLVSETDERGAVPDRLESSFEHFYDKYASIVYGAIVRVSAPSESAERIMCNVFRRVFQQSLFIERAGCRTIPLLLNITWEEIYREFPRPVTSQSDRDQRNISAILEERGLRKSKTFVHQ